MGIIHLTETCKACKGARTILGVGNIRKPCGTCSATGFIKHEKSNDTQALDEQQKKLKGRTATVRKKIKKQREIDAQREIKPEPTLEQIKPFDTNLNVMVNTNNTKSSGLF